MDGVDCLLNVAGLLLWLGARSVRLRLPPTATTRYVALLKQAQPPGQRRLMLLGCLALLIVGRSWVYWRVGTEVRWVPELDLGAIRLPFNSISWSRIALYSVLSYLLVWAVYHLWLLLLSMLSAPASEAEGWQRYVRESLGWVGRLPWPVRLLGPSVMLTALWCALHSVMVEAGIMAAPASAAQLWQQGLVIGAGAFLAWKWLILGVLFLNLVNSHLYLGSWSFWTYLSTVARPLLRPFHVLPLRIGRVDLSALVGIVVYWLLFAYGEYGLNQLFSRLPL